MRTDPLLTRHSVLPRLLERLRGAFVAIGVFSIFFNLLMLTLPLYMLSVFTRVMSSKSEETLLMLTVAAIVALLLQSLIGFVRSQLLVRIGLSLDNALSPQVLEALLRHAAGTPQRNAQRLRDATELRNFLNSPTVFVLFDAPFAPFYVVVIYLLHPALGLLALLGSLLLLGIAVGNEFLTRAPLKNANQANQQSLGRAEDFVRNADVIAAMGMMPAILREWRQRNLETLTAMARAGDRGTVATSLAGFVRTLLQVGIYGIGTYLFIHQDLHSGAIIAASILMARALAPVESAITTWRNLVSAKAAYGRLEEVLDPARLSRYQQRTPLPAPTGRLFLERVVVQPPGSDRMILKAVSFQVKPGEFIGIIGPSGAGKTTLGKVMVGILRPKAGQARLDGASLADWNPDELGTHIGYLPQDVQLFAGTVRQNIARLSRDEDSSAVIAAAQAAGAHEMILELPNGYDTEIGEGGAFLSAGQRQHIALARALYGEPKLLVLDEPNSNLDAMSERALGRALAQAKRRRITLVVITHRPSILSAADTLLVLNQGQVERYGTRLDVLAQLSQPAAKGDPHKRMAVVRGE